MEGLISSDSSRSQPIIEGDRGRNSSRSGGRNQAGSPVTGLLSLAQAQPAFLYEPGAVTAHSGLSPPINQESRQFPIDMATGQFDLGNHPIEILFPDDFWLCWVDNKNWGQMGYARRLFVTVCKIDILKSKRQTCHQSFLRRHSFSVACCSICFVLFLWF